MVRSAPMVTAHDVVDESPNVPLGAWRRTFPVSMIHEAEAIGEAGVGNRQRFSRINHDRSNLRSIPGHFAPGPGTPIGASGEGVCPVTLFIPAPVDGGRP